MKRSKITGILLVAVLAAVLAACQLGGAEEPQKNLTRPYISVQPESGSFYINDYTAPILKVEVWDWSSLDGSLSYQWYQFEDMEEYCTNGGTAISGATGTSFTPSVTPTAGKQYYFYVNVTNTKSDALDIPSASIQSEVAALSFSAVGDPLFPIIVRHPANARYAWGRALNAAKVEAKLPKDANGVTRPGALTYQWYSNTERKIEGGTLVPGADKASFMPGYDILEMDNNYYYIKVTNTLTNGRTAVSVSVPAIITMERGLKAGAPRIVRNLADRLYFAGDTVQPLSVTAESPDLGNLSYQWYSNSVTPALADTNWTEIAGAAGAAYTPPNTAGNSFYYVKITNTNENVSGEKTAILNSKAVKVRFASAGSLAENATVTIPDPSAAGNRRQYVRGYGGMDVAWESFPRTDPEDTELMYNPDRLGYNILRIMILPNNIDIKKTMEDLTAPTGHRPNYYENVKIVNKYGGYVAAAPWTPPKEWKSNNSVNGGGNLIPAYYRLFATYLRNFSQIM
jgi:hypothetical protein